LQFAARNGRRVHLTKHEIRILLALRTMTGTIDSRRLAGVVYGDDPNGGPENYNSLKSTLCRLRKKLEPLGVRITHWTNYLVQT
jgi:DNA-binding response OmpR family regulator